MVLPIAAEHAEDVVDVVPLPGANVADEAVPGSEREDVGMRDVAHVDVVLLLLSVTIDRALRSSAK